MKPVLVVIIDPLRYDLLSLFKGFKLVKPNTLLLEGPEKTLYNTVPIGLATSYVFLTNSPIFGTCQIGPSQKDGAVVRAQSETLGDSLLGSVSRDITARSRASVASSALPFRLKRYPGTSRLPLSTTAIRGHQPSSPQ